MSKDDLGSLRGAPVVSVDGVSAQADAERVEPGRSLRDEEDYGDCDDSDGFDDDLEDRFDCGLNDEDGQCSMAGTEDCDFECPNRNSEWFAGSRAFCRKHKQLYYSEVNVARHALGLDGKRKRSYRNYYTVGEGADGYDEWMSIVAKGLAVRVDRKSIMGGDWLFHLTRAGAEQALYEGETLDDDDFKSPLLQPPSGKWCFRCRRQVPVVCLTLECPHEKAALESARPASNTTTPSSEHSASNTPATASAATPNTSSPKAPRVEDRAL